MIHQYYFCVGYSDFENKMSSPVVETVRTIPLIIEKNVPMEHEENVSFTRNFYQDITFKLPDFSHSIKEKQAFCN